ncbi:MAG: RNB domain-containing ribonuclease [Acidimicrobiales bacterium]|nr:RNB domain-containing ribonuclease [Acidimicrobiales bacterium]
MLHRMRDRAHHLDLDALRSEMGVEVGFAPEVLAEAGRAASAPARRDLAEREDRTDLPLVTVDPLGSTDLDQALAIEPLADGWRVRYAIADVAAWVEPDGAVDRSARARTQTYYAPDLRAPLHPPSLSEVAASLLPDGPRPAVLWTIDVDSSGATTAVDVRRALVRSRAQLDYAAVQADLDAGGGAEAIRALPALGEALLDASRERGAIELGLPEQEVVAAPGGGWTVELRADRAIERWNAQVSLLTGRAAAWLMLEGGIGILRTLPAPDPATFPRLRRAASNLGIRWDADEHPGEVLARLDTSDPRHAAFCELAAELLRGAGYTVVRGRPPVDPGHAGVGAPYAHVTAPLRRLVDRFASEVCLSLAAGTPLPTWVDEGLDALPGAMAQGDQRARRLDRAIVDATEALVLADRVGSVFAATVIEAGPKFGDVVLQSPPIRGRCDAGDLPLGGEVHVRCTEADVAERRVRFERVS